MEDFICRYCGKVCKNKNSLAQHEIRCKKNPNRIRVVSNFIKYQADLAAGKVVKEYSNQYTKAKKLGLEVPRQSLETREKLRKIRLGTKHSEKTKQKISEGVQKAVKRNPEAYRGSKDTKHVRRIEYNGHTLIGQWELKVAKYLDSQNIKWINTISGFEYEWQGKEHKYFPDFYLPDFNLYLEVKGYQFQPDRDIQKWSRVPNLKVLRRSDIQDIQDGKFQLVP